MEAKIKLWSSLLLNHYFYGKYSDFSLEYKKVL